ncbi:MAG: VanW family protein [Clostridia bacterium]
MKKNINGEKIFVLVSLIIVITIVIIVIFTVFNSNKYFYNNDDEVKKSENHNNTASENKEKQDVNKVTKEEVDKLNVDANIAKEQLQKPSTQTPPSNPAPKADVEPVEIATYTTSIYDKDNNRVFNISKAIEKLNDTIIPNGKEFSFNNTIGPMNSAAGYKKAVGFDNKGNKVQIDGGGMCQISSTLYNAALISKLQITERHPHSRRVYYVPKNKDATIYYGSLDLKFINNTGSSIKILATNNKTNVTIRLVKI